MTFLNPTYLWALLALFIPIAIHLWSKKEGKTIKVGSIQLLDESDSKKSSSIQLNELLLLLLRLFLITVLVFIISEPQLKKKVTKTPLTYIVEPSLLDDTRIAAIIDTLDENNVRLLQKGFPKFSDDDLNSTITTPNYWLLAKQMKSLKTDSIVVFTQAFSKGIKGIRPILDSRIHWVVLDVEKSIQEIMKAEINGDSIKVVSMSSNSEQLSFTKKVFAINDNSFQQNTSKDSLLFEDNGVLKSLKLYQEKSINALTYFDDNLLSQKRYVEASLKAISEYSNCHIQISDLNDSADLENKGYDLLVWLSNKQPPKNQAKLLIYKPDYFSSSLIEKGEQSDTFYLTTSLNSDNIIEEHFAEQLLKILDLNTDLKSKISEHDNTAVALNEISTTNDTPLQSVSKIVNVAMSKWLWLLFVLSLIVERVISKIRKQ